MPSIGSTDVATLLLVEQARLSPTDRALVLSADDPALALAVGRQTASTDVYDASASALQRARQQVKARAGSALITFSDDVYPPRGGDFDVALMTVPKGRDFARAQLWSALRSLRPGGRLYVAGPTQGGAKSLIEDAGTLFGRCVTLCTRRRYRVGVAIRPDALPGYPADWGDDPTVTQQRTVDTPIGPLTVATMPGIFSWQHLDDGTAFLLDHLEVEPGQSVLDVGCGYGIIGLVAAQRARQVIMTDDNLLAIRCARATVAINHLDNAEVQPGDVYTGLAGRQFDLIVSNPPFHKDFDVNTNVAHRMMRDAKPLLRPGGRLVIVANAFLKYEAVMAQHLTKARVLARSSRFVVIEGRR